MDKFKTSIAAKAARRDFNAAITFWQLIYMANPRKRNKAKEKQQL
jgi:hypothetical protein